jgi:hypothetical protein
MAGKRRLSARQLKVLGYACTRGHVAQGCMSRSDYGGLVCTLASLRRRDLLDVMDKPTDAGRRLYAESCPDGEQSMQLIANVRPHDARA